MIMLDGGSVSAARGASGTASEFTVRLPRVTPTGDAPALDRAPVEAGRRALSLVLVEDNPDVARTMAAALEEAGHQVSVFRDGATALRALTGSRPDAILIDLGLPGMDGYELVGRVKQQAHLRQTACVALSGHGHRIPAALAGFDEYFVKPVAIDELLACLQNLAGMPAEASGGLRVLLVEDNVALAEVTADVLRDEGLEVWVAHSGTEALHKAPTCRPHVTLCDWNLPDMSGHEVVKALRADAATRQTYAVILTAWCREEIAAFLPRAIEDEIDEILCKPLLSEQIRDLIVKVRSSA